MQEGGDMTEERKEQLKALNEAEDRWIDGLIREGIIHQIMGSIKLDSSNHSGCYHIRKHGRFNICDAQMEEV